MVKKKNNIENKVKIIISKILKLSINKIKSSSGPANISKWDSLSNQNIISSLEKEFDIIFDAQDLIEMDNLSEIIGVIYSKL